jgi:hypothetical protein
MSVHCGMRRVTRWIPGVNSGEYRVNSVIRACHLGEYIPLYSPNPPLDPKPIRT